MASQQVRSGTSTPLRLFHISISEIHGSLINKLPVNYESRGRLPPLIDPYLALSHPPRDPIGVPRQTDRLFADSWATATALEEEFAMGKNVEYVPNTDLIWAVLEGGPESIPQASRQQIISSIDEKIKIVHYGGYEHFERTKVLDESGPFPQIVFRWTARTEIAELAKRPFCRTS
jgi:hypothetical protein